jgi:phage terminase large subunit GpA-like protein
MDACTDRAVDEVVLQKSAQVGGTEVLLNLCGFHIDQDPAPILVVQPSLDLVDEWSKARLATMIRDTPVLADKVAEPKSRDSANRIRDKWFPGGRITIAGANSARSLRGRPMRIVACDDVDGFPPSAGSEGDPVALARKRTTTFRRIRKVLLISTPTIKGLSRIERAFKRSDQRYFHVPCPRCGAFQRLRWGGPDAAFGVKWTEEADPDEGEPTVTRAWYVCEYCAGEWSDGERRAALRFGCWQATKQFRGIAGFHLSELYSPWASLADIAASFIEAKHDPTLLQVFVNTVLAETWEDRAEQEVDPDAIYSRRESYGPTVPAGVAVLTAGIDVQKAWLELYVKGWGRGEESWAVEHHVIRGDPNQLAVWEELDRLLAAPREHASGLEAHISAACLDTGGRTGHTQAAYNFCRDRFARRIWAIKGIGGGGRAVWPKRPSRKNLGKIDLFGIGVDAGKDVIYKRLALTPPGPGTIHYSLAFDLEFCKQLTAERPTTRHVRGYAKRVWRQIRTRNEAFDLEVYAYAALCGLRILHELDLEAEVDATEELLATPRAKREASREEKHAVASARRGRRGKRLQSRSGYWERRR